MQQSWVCLIPDEHYWVPLSSSLPWRMYGHDPDFISGGRVTPTIWQRGTWTDCRAWEKLRLKDKDLRPECYCKEACFYNWIIQAFTQRRLKKCLSSGWGVIHFKNTHQTNFLCFIPCSDNARLPFSVVWGPQCDLRNEGRETFWQARDRQSVLHDTLIQLGLTSSPAPCFPSSANWITCKKI